MRSPVPTIMWVRKGGKSEETCLEKFHPIDQIIPETYTGELGLVSWLHRSPLTSV